MECLSMRKGLDKVRKKGCLDAYCAAGNLAQMAGERLEKYFEELKQGNPVR